MKISLSFIGFIFLFLSVVSYSNTSTALVAAQKCKKLPTYEIGEDALGGIVFYLNKAKTHGLVTAKKDQMENSNYQDCYDDINNPEHHDADGKMYADWRLPKLWEAYKMYMNLHMVNLGGFSGSGYWTSKETVGFDKMHVMNFAKGIDFMSLKSDTYRARAVRTF